MTGALCRQGAPPIGIALGFLSSAGGSFCRRRLWAWHIMLCRPCSSAPPVPEHAPGVHDAQAVVELARRSHGRCLFRGKWVSLIFPWHHGKIERAVDISRHNLVWENLSTSTMLLNKSIPRPGVHIQVTEAGLRMIQQAPVLPVCPPGSTCDRNSGSPALRADAGLRQIFNHSVDSRRKLLFFAFVSTG